jgi:UDP-glucose 4-epimerase
MRVLITGGKGFVGRHLKEMMEMTGWDIVAPSKEELDILNPESFDKYNLQDFDAVIHLAALLMIDGYSPAQYFAYNAVGTFNVLEFCRKNRIPKIIYAMTHSDVNKADTIIVDEWTPQHFGTNSFDKNSIPFISSKIAAADMIAAYHRQGEVQGIILRLSNIRGVGSRDEKYNCVFRSFIDKAIKGANIEIWGDPPKTFRDLIYIKDVCSAFIAAVKSKQAFGYYNIGSGKGLTIEEEARAIIKVFSSVMHQSEIVYRRDIEEVRKVSCVFDISRARKELNWMPIYSYEEGLQDYRKEFFAGDQPNE